MHPTEIFPFLYIGNEENSANKKNLQKLGITHILNVAHQCDCFFLEDFKYMHCKLMDTDTQNIIDEFECCINFIGLFVSFVSLSKNKDGLS